MNKYAQFSRVDNPDPLKNRGYAGDIKRGDIIYAVQDHRGTEFNTKFGRPAVVISNEDINTSKMHPFIVIWLTTKPKKYAQVINVGLVGSHGEESYAVCDQIGSVDRSRIKGINGSLAPEFMEKIEKAVIKSITE